MLLPGLLIILLFLAVGEALAWALALPVPGSVLGMLLLTTALQVGWVKAEAVRAVARVLTQNMALFFVPPAVGLMRYGDLLAAEATTIVTASVVSTLLVLLSVGKLMQWAIQRKASATRQLATPRQR